MESTCAVLVCPTSDGCLHVRRAHAVRPYTGCVRKRDALPEKIRRGAVAGHSQFDGGARLGRDAHRIGRRRALVPRDPQFGTRRRRTKCTLVPGPLRIVAQPEVESVSASGSVSNVSPLFMAWLPLGNQA